MSTSRDFSRQATLGGVVELAGIGVHSGAAISITLRPADPGTGIVFLRTDFDANVDGEVRAHHALVSATDLCTVLGDVSGPSVSTVEHLLAALSAFAVDNAIVEIDGGEMPILDGSSSDFVRAIASVGVRNQSVTRRYLKVLKPIRVEVGNSFGEVRPYNGFSIDVEIDFASEVIGRQRFAFDVNAESFTKEVSRARTFGFMADVEKLWSAGFALGASLENTVVIGEDRVVNPEGLRYDDEFVRHKALDAVGDLSLAGAPLIGAFKSYRGGHSLNIALLRAIFEDRDAWSLVELEPRRSHVAYSEASPRIATAAFGPDVS